MQQGGTQNIDHAHKFDKTTGQVLYPPTPLHNYRSAIPQRTRLANNLKQSFDGLSGRMVDHPCVYVCSCLWFVTVQYDWFEFCRLCRCVCHRAIQIPIFAQLWYPQQNEGADPDPLKLWDVSWLLLRLILL